MKVVGEYENYCVEDVDLNKESDWYYQNLVEVNNDQFIENQLNFYF